MKVQRISVLALLLIAIGTMWAQPRLQQPEMYVGVHGGVLASMPNFRPVLDGTSNLMQSAFLGGNGGLVFRYNGHKYCGLQVELNYMQRGWRESWSTETESGKYRRELHYAELPFLMHLYFGKQHRFMVNLGPQIGYCVYDKQSGDEHPLQKVQYGGLDKRFDWGIAAGIGYVANTRKSGSFQIEARFNYSFGDLFNTRRTDYFSRAQTMNVSLNLGYLLCIKSFR